MFSHQTEASPQKALIIVLGSGFNSHQETEFKFTKQLLEAKFEVDVLSIDEDEKKYSPPKNTMPHLQVMRICDAITEPKVDELFSVGANRFLSNLQSYQQIIIVDSIRFIQIDGLPGHLFLEKIKTQCEKNIKSHATELSLLHYVSPMNPNPTLNGHAITTETLVKLKINLDEFVMKSELLWKEISNQPFYKFLRALTNFMERKEFVAANNQFKQFLSGGVLPALPKEIRDGFKLWLSEKIEERISKAELQLITSTDKLSFDHYRQKQ